MAPTVPCCCGPRSASVLGTAAVTVEGRPLPSVERDLYPNVFGAVRCIGKEAQKGSLLFEDLPPASSTDSGPGGPLLFDDLPPAGSGESGSLAVSISQTIKNEGKGAKRKTSEEENGNEELVEKKVCKASSVIFGLKGYVAERKGEREEMQDAHVILNDITDECRPPSSLMSPSSQAILCRYNEESQRHAALSLSKEHNPTQYEERMRIQKAGGNVRDGRVLGVLEVSRSIGDGQYKRCGVTSVPDIRRCQLTPNDRFILLACDGLFKVFTPEEAVNFILSCLEDEKIQTREGKPAIDARYEAACNRLANKAVQRGSADNVTVMVVRIGQ
uniref:integrin-linked kinase-associated serine/threonine phosphatase 2C n=1 Tax=Ictidomys tridecemlineatus TaxID=43179 RepID=UPI001A9FF69A|nr:integrin-linked kinase-associated serine/threonine phosphatase 2C [Ictidomys tridecemlineatus]